MALHLIVIQRHTQAGLENAAGGSEVRVNLSTAGMLYTLPAMSQSAISTAQTPPSDFREKSIPRGQLHRPRKT